MPNKTKYDISVYVARFVQSIDDKEKYEVEQREKKNNVYAVFVIWTKNNWLATVIMANDVYKRLFFLSVIKHTKMPAFSSLSVLNYV